MNYSIIKSISNSDILIYIGWILIGLLFSWGNTSLGFIFLLIHLIIYFIKNKKTVKLNNFTDKKIYFLLSLFMVWSLISAFFSYNKKIAFASFIGFLLLIVISLVETKLLVSFKKFKYKILFSAVSIGLTISSSYIIYNYFSTNIRRATGIFSAVNDTGSVLLVAVLIVISYFEFLNNKYRYLLLMPIMLGFLSLILTFSRGAFFGFIAGLFIFNLRSKKRILIFCIIIFLIFSFIITFPQLENRFLDSLTIKDNMDRVSIWISSVNMIKDHPIIGIGPGNFPVVYPSYRWKEEQRTHTMSFAHNIFLNMAVETGLIGFGLFFYIIILILIMGVKIYYNNPLNRGFVSAFIAILAHNQFDCTVLKFEVGVIFWILIGLIIAIYFSNKN